jgi:acyl-coenzyme A synthetase/AMP-(fatty) acid ligase
VHRRRQSRARLSEPARTDRGELRARSLRRSGARLYRTGDLCRIVADGTLVFLGRRDQQVKLRGHRIELGEIEAALRAQPGVRDAIAILHGPSDARRIIAYAATDLDPATLAKQIAPLLPPIAHPALIIPLDAIPTTPNGKRDPARLPDPDRIAATTYLPPQTTPNDSSP